jgi:hypothetical protein
VSWISNRFFIHPEFQNADLPVLPLSNLDGGYAKRYIGRQAA